MLSVTFFFNQTDKIRFWSVWAINSFLGIWMTVEQNKLSGFFIRSIWPLQIGGRRKIRDRKMIVFFSKNMFQNPVLVQHLQCDHSALSFGSRSTHNASRGCPEVFFGVYDHHRGWGAVNPALRLPGILRDLWMHRSKCEIGQNDRCSPTRIYYSPRPGGGHTLTEMPQDNPPMVL